MQKIDFINFKKYYQNALKKLPQDNFYQKFITHKVVHFAAVLHIWQVENSHEKVASSP